MPLLASFMVPHPPLIVPSVGKGSEHVVQKTIDSYKAIANEIADLSPETIVIISPHSVMYQDYFHISPGKRAVGSLASFRAPDVTFDEEYDEELREEIVRYCDDMGLPCGTLGERDPELDHGTMVPLWFIRNSYKGGKIVRLGLSGLPLKDHYALGGVIGKAIDSTGRRTVIVASGDLSHKLKENGPYGLAPEGAEYDERIMDVMSRSAFDELLLFDEVFLDRAAECGHRSFVIMAGAWQGSKVISRAYSHEDQTGVGYGICSFYPESGPDIYVRLATLSIEKYIRTGKRLALPDDLISLLEGNSLPLELTSSRAGAFVSIHKNGDLRGCIGTISPLAPSLMQEIADNAVSASTRDPRFPSVRENELSSLEINVDVLKEPEDIDSLDKLDVKRYGVIVSTPDGRRGLLLPDLEGVDTVEDQVMTAMQKGGIKAHEKFYLQRFEVVRHR